MSTDGEIIRECGDDAAKWAKAFIEVIGDLSIVIDEALMVGWFANAIESRRRLTDLRDRDQEPGAAPAQSPPIESAAGLACAREAPRAAASVGQPTTEEPTHDMLRERRLRLDPDRNKASEPPMPPAPPSGTTELRDHRARTIDALLTAIDRELAGAAQPIDCVGTLAHAVAVLAGAPL